MTDVQNLKEIKKSNTHHNAEEDVSLLDSMVNQMNPEVDEKDLDQISNFASAVVSLLTHYKAIIESAVNSNNELAKETIASCQSIIDCLKEQAQTSQTFEEKKYYLTIMMQLSEKVAQITAESQHANREIVEVAGITIITAVILIGCTFGLKGQLSSGTKLIK